MAEDITRIIEVDTSASVKTVRELQEEVAALNKDLQSLKEGTTEYAAAQQQAAQKQQQLSAAFEISRESAEDMAVSAERLAGIAAEDQKAIAGVVEAMRAMGDAGTGANGVLQDSADTLGVVTESVRQQTAAVSELEQQQNAFIQQAVQEAGILSDVSNQRKALNKAISDGTISEEDAVRMKEQLLKVETTYKASLSETQATLKATTKQMQAAAGSYDQMSQQLGQLRNAYRQMSKAARESTEGKAVIGKIQNLDKELKNIDASMGNFQRNVGNYNESLGGLGKAFAALKGSISMIGVAVGVAVGVFKSLKGTIDSTQTTGDAWSVAVVGWNSAWDVFKKSLASGTFENLTSRILEARDAGEQLAMVLDSVFERTNSINIQAAQMSETNAQLYVDMQDVNKSYEERTAAGEKYLENVTNIKNQEIEVAKEVRDAQLESLFTVTNTRRFASNEAREAAKQAFADGIKTYNINEKLITLANDYTTALNQQSQAQKSLSTSATTALLNSQIGSAASEKAADAFKKLQKVAGDSTQAVIDFVKQYNLSNDADVKGYVDSEVAYNKMLGDRLSQNRRVYNTINSIRKKQSDEDQKVADDTAKAANKATEEEQKRAKAIADANREIERRIELMNAELGTGTEEGDVALEQEKYRQELEAFNTMVMEKGITEANAMAYREALVAEHEARIADIRQTYRDAEFDALITELDKEMAAEFKSGQQILAQEKKNSAEKERIEKLKRDTTLNVASSTLSSLSTILGQETAAGKAAAVASATIDTYKAANSAYAALAGIPFVGPGLGVAAAAAAIVAGVANVKQILSTSTDGVGASVANSSASPATPAIVTPPAVIQEVPIVRSLTGASEEERLNQMASDQRVYLVYSDVEQAGQQVRVQQSETSF